MEQTIIIKITDQKVIKLLHELEELNLIQVIESTSTSSQKLSDKYRGVLSKKQGEDLLKHIKEMRSEWDNI